MNKVQKEILIIITCLLLGYITSHKFLEFYKHETSTGQRYSS